MPPPHYDFLIKVCSEVAKSGIALKAPLSSSSSATQVQNF